MSNLLLLPLTDRIERVLILFAAVFLCLYYAVFGFKIRVI